VKRGEVIEYEGIVVEANDDGTLDLLVPEYTGDESSVIEGIRGVFPAGGPYTLPIPGQVVIVEQRYPSRDPRTALRWVGHEHELPTWLDTDRTGIRSRTGRMAVIFDEDLQGDGTDEPALLLGGLGADQKAVLGDVLVAKLGVLIDKLATALVTVAASQYGSPPGPMEKAADLVALKQELVGPDGAGGLKAELADTLSTFVRVAKVAAEAEDGEGRTAEAVE